MTSKKRGQYDESLHIDEDFEQAVERYVHTDPQELDEATSEKQFQRQIEALLAAFEDAKHVTENGVEIWFARDLMALFEYPRWQKFRSVVGRAYVSCRESGIDPAGHFATSTGAAWTPDEVFTQKGKNPQGGRPQEDIILTRRAAYLIAENGDASKPPIAVAQRYFSEQTRRQEVIDQSVEALTEDQRRVLIRDEVIEQQKGLASAAHASGVKTPKDFAIFQTEGYKGMYGGLNVEGIKKAKGIGRDAILDRMGSTELAANLFRLTQTEERLKRGDIKTKAAANRTHRDIGKKVRKTMQEISGVKPEDIEASDHIKHARKRVASVESAPELPEPKKKTRKKSK